MQDGVLITDAKGNLILLNDALVRFHRLSHRDEHPRTLDELNKIIELQHEDGTPVENETGPISRAMRGETGAGVVFRLQRFDGGEAWFGSCSFGPIRDQAGEIEGAVLVMRDITQSLLDEQALRQSEHKFRDLFRGHSAVKLIVEPSSGSILDANQAAADFYGWTRQELVAMSLHDLGASTPESVLAQIGRANDAHRTSYEACHILADGTERDVEIYASHLVIDQQPVLYCILHDISTRRELADQLSQAQRIESVGRLAGGVAHDFNNMLSVIQGYTEMALDEVSEDELLRVYLTEIKTAGERSAAITRQLLAFARKQAIAPQRLDLNDTVEGMLKMLRRLIGEDIEMLWQPGPNVYQVRIDPSQVDQLLANLCVNARDAIDGVGQVIIETANHSFDESFCEDHPGYQPGHYVMLAVTDDGCGMDRKTLDLIFEPFFTTRPQGEGTGLGLATVYGIVRQNEGFIRVYSEVGEGSSFKIYLPRDEMASAMAETREVAEIPRSAGETLLLVEDDDAARLMTRRMLKRLGYSVIESSLPDEAVRFIEEHGDSIDLLLTDVVMPGMNGKELAERVGELNPQIRVLFMSGYTANVIENRGVIEAGVHFVPKPFSMEQLAFAVRNALTSD